MEHDGERDRKLAALGYPLERTTPEGSLVDPLAIDGNTVYASGQVPFDGDRLVSVGKVRRSYALIGLTLCGGGLLTSQQSCPSSSS